MKEDYFTLSMHPEESLIDEMPAREFLVGHCTLLCTYTGQLCMWPCSLTKNIEFRLLLPHSSVLPLGKKSIEWLTPIEHQQTSALELLLVWYFRILSYTLEHYTYGMLIIPRVRGPCPTPPSNHTHMAWSGNCRCGGNGHACSDSRPFSHSFASPSSSVAISSDPSTYS